MKPALVVLPILLPLLGAACSMMVGRSRRAQRVVGLLVLTSVTVLSVILAVVVDRDGPVVVQGGGWPAPVGVTLVADRLSSMLLAVAATMLLAVLVYAIGQPGAERRHVGFQSIYLVLAAGVAASFLTGDLFTLFVAFEMMLTASYVLITLGARPDQVRAGMTYVVLSLIASLLFLTALALVYAATGTVNLADLAVRMPGVSPGLRSALAVLLLVVFGIKAGLFPLFFWLPDSYPVAPSAVTAVFAGLLTKVGVYAIIRTQTLLFGGAWPDRLLLVLAGATMVVGALGALAQADVKRILSFQIISHIGTLVLGLGLFTVAGLAGTLFYLVHHIVVTTALFLTGGLVEHAAGTGRLRRIDGLARTAPVLAALFLVSAGSLAGIPPLSGFVGKFAIVAAAGASGQHLLIGVTLAASLLTLYSLVKIWSGAFWSRADEPPDGQPHAVGRSGGPLLMVLPTVALTLLGLAVAIGAAPIYDLSHRAAADLLDAPGYIRAVLG